MHKGKKSLWTLFCATFMLSAFTFGGGYVIVPLMKKKFVDELGWLEEEEMLNLVAIGQSAPGALAVNASILLGFRVAGPVGALCTVLGTVLPPLITLSAISLCYDAFRHNLVVSVVLKGMQAGVAAVIAEVVAGMLGGILKGKDAVSIAVMAGAFAAVAAFGVNVAVIILACAALGAGRSLWGKGGQP